MTPTRPCLSEGLAAMTRDFEGHEMAGKTLSPAEVRMVIAVLTLMRGEARRLEQAERERDQLLAIASDLEVADMPPSLNGLRAALARGVAVQEVVRDPASNVVAFPVGDRGDRA